MSNNKDFKVKNGIQPTSYFEGVGTVVSGSVGYYLSGASYDSKSFSIASQDANPTGLVFKSDGTKAFIGGNDTDTVYQYTLSTAWDISTTSYDSVSFNLSSQDTSLVGLTFKPDGTSFYALGSITTRVYQYTLSTAWDLSTASYANKSFLYSSQEGGMEYVRFKPDGTKMYLIGADTDAIYQYTLSTAWDISTASYDSVSFSVASQELSSRTFDFTPSGSSIFVLGDTNSTVYQYTLSTAWDISTASYSGFSFSITSQDTQPRAIGFGDNGAKMYVLGRVTDTIYQYSTVLNTASLDLSTGSVFDYTPTSDVQVTLSNPAASGTSSGATLLLGAEDAVGVSSTFSTTLYNGNGGTQTITNGIDLAGDGGLVWIKKRNGAVDHYLADTERGATKFLVSNTTDVEDTNGSTLTSFNNNGFTIGDNARVNSYTLTDTFASWTFKKAAGFFDVVTYTGTGSSNPISHNLGVLPGCMIFKKTSASEDWYIFNRNNSGTYYSAVLNSSNAAVGPYTAVDLQVSDTTFNPAPLGTNTNGATYVAYFFAHDVAADGLIQCGSYTGNGSTNGPEINLGWEPQWIMIKRADSTSDWRIFDSIRGWVQGGDDAILKANTTSTEAGSTFNALYSTATGFKLESVSGEVNGSGGTYIYIAIRAPYTPTVTYDPNLQWSAGTAPTAPALGETDVITFNTTDGGTTYTAVQAIDGAA